MQGVPTGKGYRKKTGFTTQSVVNATINRFTHNLLTMIKIGLLGCGNIGHIIATHASGFEISAVFDKVPGRAQEIAAISGSRVCKDFGSFINADIDIVVEAASVSAAKAYAIEVLTHRKDMVIMSVGALTDAEFREKYRTAAQASAKKVYVPSGAIFGLDNLKVGRISTISRLLLKTTKSPASSGLKQTQKRGSSAARPTSASRRSQKM